MKITFVLPGYPRRPVGAFRVVYEYANQLVARGHQVAAVHARRMKDDKGIYAPRGIYRRLRRQAAYTRDALLVPNVRWQAIDERVQMLYVPEPLPEYIPDADVVLATAWDTVQYVCRYPIRKGAKFHLIQSYDYWSQLEGDVDAVWRSDISKIVISKWLGDKMTELGCGEFAYIPNAINHSKFRLTRPIEGRPKRVAMLYSMAECKGSQDGLRALRIAKEEHPDMQAVLFGIPKRPRDLPGWIEYFRDPTPHDHVQNVYNGSSVYLCPSVREASPLPPAEAMACGCALVTADCLGIREYAEDGVNALVSPPREPQSLAKNLLRVLGDETLSLRLARNGRTRIREFSWKRSTDKLELAISDRISAIHERSTYVGA